MYKDTQTNVQLFSRFYTMFFYAAEAAVVLLHTCNVWSVLSSVLFPFLFIVVHYARDWSCT